MATYYVANAGSNGANGTSTGTPWQTLAWAQTHTTAGDTVLLNKGDTFTEGSGATPSFLFPGNNMMLSSYGTGAAPIINGASATRRIVDCSAVTGTTTTGLTLLNGGGGTGSNWLASAGTNTITNCTVDGHATDACVSVNSSGTAVISNCIIKNAFDDGVTLHTTATATVLSCTITLCSQGINNSGTAMVMTVSDTTFSENSNSDINGLAATTAVFNRCTFLGKTGGGTVFCTGDGAGGTTTFNYCLFNGSKGTSSADCEFSPQGAQTVTLNNCVFYGGTVPAGKMSFGDGTIVNAKNTIFYSMWKAAILSGTAVFNADYCVFNAIGTKATTTNTNELTSDPLFTNAAGGIFTIPTGSPAKYSGTAISGLVTDLAGNLVHSPPSRGAYEFGTAAAISVNAATINAATLRVG